MSLPNIIAVDGPAGSGKSSVSFAVAQQIGYLFVDTGAFYRAVTLVALEHRVDVANPEQITALAWQTHLDMTPDLSDDGRQYTILADGQDITWRIHEPAIDANVSVVSKMPGVRDALMQVQRTVAQRGRVIAAGRDIGTVVLPDADLKIYIDASLEARALRRYQQRIDNGEAADLNVIMEGLQARDQIDSNRDVAPLRRASDAIYLDTTTLNFDQSVEAMQRIINEWTPVKKLADNR